MNDFSDVPTPIALKQKLRDINQKLMGYINREIWDRDISGRYLLVSGETIHYQGVEDYTNPVLQKIVEGYHLPAAVQIYAFHTEQGQGDMIRQLWSFEVITLVTTGDLEAVRKLTKRQEELSRAGIPRIGLD